MTTMSQQGYPCVAECAQAMQNGPREPRFSGYFRIGMKRIAVSIQPVHQRCLKWNGPFIDDIRFPCRHFMRRFHRPARPTKTAIPPAEARRLQRRDELSCVFAVDFTLRHDQRALADSLVYHALYLRTPKKISPHGQFRMNC